MKTNRLEALVDAVIAIVMTIVVLQIPQPKEATFPALMDLGGYVIPYFISFMLVIMLWQNHHKMYTVVRDVDEKVIYSTALFLFIVTFVPFVTIFVSNNFHSFVAQFTYGMVFIMMGIMYTLTSKFLLDIEENQELQKVIDHENAEIQIVTFKVVFFRVIAFAIGLVLALFGFPEAISIGLVVSFIVIVVPIEKFKKLFAKII